MSRRLRARVTRASAWSAAKRYSMNFGKAILNSPFSVLGLAKRAFDFVTTRKLKKAGRCGCFIGSTLVWTASGAVPIDEIEEGMVVLAAHEDGLVTNAVESEVGEKIVIGYASLVHLTIQHADEKIETIYTTDEHPFHNALTGELIRADALRPDDRITSMHGVVAVVAIAFGSERVPGYNLSIPGSPTYFVGELGLWVHNCSKFTIRNQKYAGGVHPKTNVPFDALGYPDFSNGTIVAVVLESGHKGRRADFAEANRLAGYASTPHGYTWHHHQDNHTMQLVDRAIHQATGHTGSRPGP